MSRPKQYAKGSQIDFSALVKEIKARPELWDIRNPSRHNRLSLNDSWSSVGSVFNQTADVCRKKWKYLKDQYRKELRTELETGPHFKSNWNLYEELIFIKPFFKSLLFAHGVQNYSIDLDQDQEIKYGNEDLNDYFHAPNISVDVDIESSPELEDCNENEEMDDWKFSCRLSNDDNDTVDITEDDNDSAVILSEIGKQPVKKIRLSSRIDSTESRTQFSEDSNDNFHFFKSLLPFMNKLNDVQKLRVRNTMQNVILHELENSSHI
ncbi:hypothetical protein ACFFRR_005970 [Megaselia abdita]